MRQIHVKGKWTEGTPTEQGQSFRHMTATGWAYGVYVGEVMQEHRRITKLAFKLRMTIEERIAIRDLAKTDAVAADFLDLQESARYIDLDWPETIGGVNALFSTDRAESILTAPIAEREKYRGEE